MVCYCTGGHIGCKGPWGVSHVGRICCLMERRLHKADIQMDHTERLGGGGDLEDRLISAFIVTKFCSHSDAGQIT